MAVGSVPDLSLVMPTFNEEARLPRALERLASFAEESKLRLEVVVANDGSSDLTREIARRWASEHSSPAFAVVQTEIRHRGKGAAVRAGMRLVSAPVVGYCDADLSAGPDAIRNLLAAVREGADVAIASRALPESVLEVRQPWYRERAGRLFNFFLRSLTRIPYHDTQCGLKLFRAEPAREIFRHQRLDGFAFDAELVVLAVRLGYSVVEVPVRWAHDENSRLSMFRDSLRMARDIVRIVRRLGRGKLHTPGIPAAPAIEMMTTSEDRHWWYVAKRRLVGRQLEQHAAEGACLDIGCGGGAMVAQAGASRPAFGIDLSDQALGHARARGLGGLVRAEGGNLPFAPGSFAVALALDVLEHHPEPERLLLEIRRVLSDDGVLVVTVPAFQWMWSYADHVLGHYRRYTRPQLAGELLSAGFTPGRVTYFHSWLLPAAWLFRKLRSMTGRTESADDFPLPRPLNAMLLALARLEMRYLGNRDLPFGLSLLAVARPVPGPAGRPASTTRSVLEPAGSTVSGE